MAVDVDAQLVAVRPAEREAATERLRAFLRQAGGILRRDVGGVQLAVQIQALHVEGELAVTGGGRREAGLIAQRQRLAAARQVVMGAAGRALQLAQKALARGDEDGARLHQLRVPEVQFVRRRALLLDAAQQGVTLR